MGKPLRGADRTEVCQGGIETRGGTGRAKEGTNAKALRQDGIRGTLGHRGPWRVLSRRVTSSDLISKRRFWLLGGDLTAESKGKLGEPVGWLCSCPDQVVVTGAWMGGLGTQMTGFRINSKVGLTGI